MEKYVCEHSGIEFETNAKIADLDYEDVIEWMKNKKNDLFTVLTPLQQRQRVIEKTISKISEAINILEELNK